MHIKLPAKELYIIILKNKIPLPKKNNSPFDILVWCLKLLYGLNDKVIDYEWIMVLGKIEGWVDDSEIEE